MSLCYLQSKLNNKISTEPVQIETSTGSVEEKNSFYLMWIIMLRTEEFLLARLKWF